MSAILTRYMRWDRLFEQRVGCQWSSCMLEKRGHERDITKAIGSSTELKWNWKWQEMTGNLELGANFPFHRTADAEHDLQSTSSFSGLKSWVGGSTHAIMVAHWGRRKITASKRRDVEGLAEKEWRWGYGDAHKKYSTFLLSDKRRCRRKSALGKLDLLKLI